MSGVLAIYGVLQHTTDTTRDEPDVEGVLLTDAHEPLSMEYLQQIPSLQAVMGPNLSQSFGYRCITYGITPVSIDNTFYKKVCAIAERSTLVEIFIEVDGRLIEVTGYQHRQRTDEAYCFQNTPEDIHWRALQARRYHLPAQSA